MAFNRGLDKINFPEVCRDCRPPKRSSHCHASCKDYLDAKAKFDAEAGAIRAARKAAREAERAAFLLKRG